MKLIQTEVIQDGKSVIKRLKIVNISVVQIQPDNNLIIRLDTGNNYLVRDSEGKVLSKLKPRLLANQFINLY